MKWSCSWWKNLTVIVTTVWAEKIIEAIMMLGILNNWKISFIVQFVVQNLQFYCCCIKLEFSFGKKKHRVLFTINHRPLFQ